MTDRKDPTTKARHFRMVDERSNQVVHFTVLSKLVHTDDSHPYNDLFYKVSYCSPKDTFRKKTGLDEAESKHIEYHVPVPKNLHYTQINNLVLVDLINRRDDAPKAHRKVLAQRERQLNFG